MDSQLLSVGTIAKICGVCHRTVTKWIDRGQLKGYRVPGSNHRRVDIDALTEFMEQHGIPLEGLAWAEEQKPGSVVITKEAYVALVQVLSEFVYRADAGQAARKAYGDFITEVHKRNRWIEESKS